MSRNKPHRRAVKAESAADKARGPEDTPVPPLRLDTARPDWWTPVPGGRRGARKPKGKTITYTPPPWRTDEEGA